jgi:hypothetical protein
MHPHRPAQGGPERVRDRNGFADETPEGDAAEAPAKVERGQAETA